MGKQGIEEKERKRKERNIIGEKDKRREEDTRKGTGSPTGHKHVAKVGKGTYRMPMESYSRIQQIQINGQTRHRRKGKETKGKEHHRRKGQEKGRGYGKREQVTPHKHVAIVGKCP